MPNPDAMTKYKRATLADVAARAGVSAVTVSRVLRHPEMVSDALRARVEGAVGELGYVRNQLASALASTRTGLIGVVVPSLTNGVFVDYLTAVHEVMVPAGFQVMVLNVRYSAEEEERAIDTLLGHHVEAMIVAGVDQTERSRLLLMQAGVPVVQTMDLTDDPVDLNIGLSHRAAGYAAAGFLYDRGRRHIGHLTARLDPRARRRHQGYLQALEERGIASAGLVASTPRASTVRIGGELFLEILGREPAVDAIFCCNDDLALGAMFECQRRGIRVPEDIAILGFNDLEYCASTHPTLSSVATPRGEMARQASRAVLEIIRGSGERPANRRIDLGFEVTDRETTGPGKRVAAPITDGYSMISGV
jgi:LacI family gluconate utilization system Gnt-I transcriptional repressor